MLKEFREFLNRGSVMDLAIGVIIGAAFGKIVSSLVEYIISPIIGLILGGVKLQEAMIITLRDGYTDDAGTLVPPLVMKFGAFFQTLIDFVIIAFVIFLIVKGLNRMRKKTPPPAPAVHEPTKEEILLTEIRDLLRK